MNRNNWYLEAFVEMLWRFLASGMMALGGVTLFGALTGVEVLAMGAVPVLLLLVGLTVLIWFLLNTESTGKNNVKRKM